MNWDRFCVKATAHLREHDDHLAVQKLRRNRQLTRADLSSFEQMLYDLGAQATHLERAVAHPGGLGLFLRSLTGLDRGAAMDAFARFLDASVYSVDQVRFVEMLVEELTDTGVMDPGRLFESPYTDNLPRPDLIFPEGDLLLIVDTLRDVRSHAMPEDRSA